MLRSMPKHETEPHEPWLAKPPFRPRHVQRNIHWLAPHSFGEVETPELEVDATDRFDTLEEAVYCLIYDFNLSDIHIPSHIRRMFQWH